MTASVRIRFVSMLAAAVAVVALTTLRASGPVFWTVASQADFLTGTSTGVSIDAMGRLQAAPAVVPVQDVAAPQVWSLARAADGTWYAGTGGDGRVVRGRGTEMTTVLDVDQAGVYAVAVSGARVFAASSPDGAVHVIEPDGSSRVFFDPAEPYIWALAFDGQGRLWVGAGHPATIYRVSADGASTVVLRPPTRHVVSLALDPRGRMLAGTDSPARLYRFDGAGQPSVLFESPLHELRAIAMAPGGGVFAAAMTATGEPSGDAPMVGSVSITIGGAPTSTSTTAGPATPPSGRRSTLYHVDDAGVWEAIWETTDAIYDLSAVDERAVLVATGPDARLYQVSLDRQVQLITTADARQLTRLVADGARTLVATANPGRVAAITRNATASTATYTSAVRDGRTLSQWGAIQWDGEGAVTLQTRAGNTETPDDSWSAWSQPYTQATGQAITSPPARYLQWRATFPSAASRLTSVTVAYLPRNLRPAVTEITVHPAGVVFQRPFSSDEGAIAGLDDAVAEARRPPGGDPAPAPSLGRRMFQRGLRTLQWKAEDPDGDRLRYTLHYRREGEATWRALRSDLADPLFVWDTTTVADGRYFLRVTASDALGNTPDRVLTGDRESDVVDVDNTPPVVTLTASGTRVDVRVTDGHSGVHRVEYALGGQGWQALSPADGLADSREERFVVTLPDAAALTTLVIRATDVMQNVTSVAGR